MIHWESTTSGVHAAGPVGEVQVRTADWRSTATGPSLDRPVDEAATGVTTSFSLAGTDSRLYDAAAGTQRQVPAGGTQLDGGEYVLEVDADLAVVARFAGPAEIAGDGRVAVRFDEPTAVTFGFRTVARAPADTVVIPKTLDGVAAGVTHAASAHRVTCPDRSRFAMRRHPPQFAFGDELDVPDRVAAETPETGIELLVPRSLRSVFVVAPLAYYLGAEVRVDAGVSPQLRAPAAGVAHTFESLETEVPDLLARVFWLDCLTRSGGPSDELRVAEQDALETLDIDPAEAYQATPAERLAAYLDAPFEQVAGRFPEWHLSMHVAPNLEHVSALPFLLDRLAAIYPPETGALESQELMERSLDDFYRSAPGPVATVEMLKPKLRDGRAQGWLADGTPIDVFKTHPAAYQNHLDYVRRPAEEMSVAVVLNDQSMAGEHEAVADVYQSRAESLPIDVSLYEGLTRAELAALFREHHGFVHYIGHCEVDGLRCSDGNLAVSDLEETNVETFFLNACGSYYEGLDLVKRGSVAGAVTFRKVLDEQAAKVGTAFARLLVNGFPIETALRLARRRIRMGKDYAVVGDGMQTLSHTDAEQAQVAHVTRRPSGECQVSWEELAVNAHGDTYDVAADAANGPRFCGNPTEFTMTDDELAAFLEGGDHPVIVDGEFYWADEVTAMLRGRNVD